MEPPRIIPKEGMVGHLLLGQLRAYLNWESETVELKNRAQIIDALKTIFGEESKIFSQITEADYIRLAEATLTIGSKALDRITFRLRVIGNSAGWGHLDYRTLASVVHTAINQGRKLKNSSAQRKKCVKSVLAQSNLEEIEIDADEEAYSVFMETIDESSFPEWADKVFANFRKSNVVNPKFVDTYQNEWREFIADARRYFFQSEQSFRLKENSEQAYFITQKYEKYLSALLSDTSKTNLKWAFEKAGKDEKRADISIDNGVTVDLKKRPDYFAFIVNIPAEFKSDFHEIPLALMDLLEKNPGFKYVDISQPASNSNQIEIQIHDKYTMVQLGTAQSEILRYFSEHF